MSSRSQGRGALPISVAKRTGSLSKPRTASRNSQAPEALRVNSATVAAVAPATRSKPSVRSSPVPLGDDHPGVRDVVEGLVSVVLVDRHSHDYAGDGGRQAVEFERHLLDEAETLTGPAVPTHVDGSVGRSLVELDDVDGAPVRCVRGVGRGDDVEMVRRPVPGARIPLEPYIDPLQPFGVAAHRLATLSFQATAGHSRTVSMVCRTSAGPLVAVRMYASVGAPAGGAGHGPGPGLPTSPRKRAGSRETGQEPDHQRHEYEEYERGQCLRPRC